MMFDWLIDTVLGAHNKQSDIHIKLWSRERIALTLCRRHHTTLRKEPAALATSSRRIPG